MSRNYRGRFAPSPTGPLHIGSLLAAVASYLDARARRGSWLVRIDDIDPPREQAGASTQILEALRAHALDWDGEVLLQSTRRQAHEQAVVRLLELDRAFYCDCSRRDIASRGGVYPGTCRGRRIAPEGNDHAIRLLVPDTALSFTDRLQGQQRFKLTLACGDFVIRRRDGLIAYQLACALDDSWQKISHVVRGIDLLASTPRQILVQRQLGLNSPKYAHIPVIVDANGTKLSKQSGALPIDPALAGDNLLRCLRLLGQEAPPRRQRRSCSTLLQWAAEHWRPEKLHGRTVLTVP